MEKQLRKRNGTAKVNGEEINIFDDPWNRSVKVPSELVASGWITIGRCLFESEGEDLRTGTNHMCVEKLGRLVSGLLK